MLPRWGKSGALTNISGEQGLKHRQRRPSGNKKKPSRQKRNNLSGALSASKARARSPPRVFCRRATDARRVAKPLGAPMHVARVARDRVHRAAGDATPRRGRTSEKRGERVKRPTCGPARASSRFRAFPAPPARRLCVRHVEVRIRRRVQLHRGRQLTADFHEREQRAHDRTESVHY